MFWQRSKKLHEIKCQLEIMNARIDTFSYRLEAHDNEILQNQLELNDEIAKSIDKCDECLKNVEKLNAMINEFKGCVSLARAALKDQRSKP